MAEGWRAQKPRFWHGTGWSPHAHSIGKCFLWRIVLSLLNWNFRPRLAWLYLYLVLVNLSFLKQALSGWTRQYRWFGGYARFWFWEPYGCTNTWKQSQHFDFGWLIHPSKCGSYPYLASRISVQDLNSKKTATSTTKIIYTVLDRVVTVRHFLCLTIPVVCAQFGGPVCIFKLLLVDFLVAILNPVFKTNPAVGCVTWCFYIYLAFGFSPTCLHIGKLGHGPINVNMAQVFDWSYCRWMDGRGRCATASAKQQRDKNRSYTHWQQKTKVCQGQSPQNFDVKTSLEKQLCMESGANVFNPFLGLLCLQHVPAANGAKETASSCWQCSS